MTLMDSGIPMISRLGVGALANRTIWAECEAYYIGNQRIKGLGTLIRGNTDLMEMARPVNFVSVIVDEPAGYIAEATFAVTHRNGGVKAWAESWIKRRLRPVLADTALYQSLYGEVYWYLNPDYEGIRRGLKVRAVAPFENGRVRVAAEFRGDDDEEVERAALEYPVRTSDSLEVREQRVEITDTTVITYERQRNPLTQAEGDWLRTGQEENPFNLVPLVRVGNHRQGSDVTRLIDLQDDLNTGTFDYRVSRKLHAFPVLYTPSNLTGSLTISPGLVMQNVQDLRRIEGANLSGILDGNANTVQQLAILGESLMIANLRGVQLSGIALERLQDAFQNKMAGKCAKIGSSAALALALAAQMIAEDPALYEMENPRDTAGNRIPQEAFFDVDFDVTLTPKDESDEIRAIEMDDHSVQNNAMSIRTYADRRGLDGEAEFKRIIEEQRMLSEAGAERGAGTTTSNWNTVRRPAPVSPRNQN